MARARNIKPSFFKNEILAALPAGSQLLFIGLWCLADREGRLEDRPARIKAEVYPYSFSVADIEGFLAALTSAGFIRRYAVNGTSVIQVVNFLKHQNPHHREQPSILPAEASPGQAPGSAQPNPVEAVLIPDSPFLIPDSPNHANKAPVPFLTKLGSLFGHSMEWASPKVQGQQAVTERKILGWIDEQGEEAVLRLLQLAYRKGPSTFVSQLAYRVETDKITAPKPKTVYRDVEVPDGYVG